MSSDPGLGRWGPFVRLVTREGVPVRSSDVDTRTEKYLRKAVIEFRICLQCRRPDFHPWVGKISWGREWPPSPVFLLGEVHRQRSLVGYSSWGHKESDMAE